MAAIRCTGRAESEGKASHLKWTFRRSNDIAFLKQYIELSTISCNAVLIEYILFELLHKFSFP
jgi:hypothetical protein